MLDTSSPLYHSLHEILSSFNILQVVQESTCMELGSLLSFDPGERHALRHDHIYCGRKKSIGEVSQHHSVQQLWTSFFLKVNEINLTLIFSATFRIQTCFYTLYCQFRPISRLEYYRNAHIAIRQDITNPKSTGTSAIYYVSLLYDIDH